MCCVDTHQWIVLNNENEDLDDKVIKIRALPPPSREFNLCDVTKVPGKVALSAFLNFLCWIA